MAARGASRSPGRARTLTRAQSGCRLCSGLPRSPAPTPGHGHHFRSRHPAASSPRAAFRTPLGLGAPGLGDPDPPSTFTRLGAVLSTGWEFRPSAPSNRGGVPAFLEAAPGGRRGEGGS